MLITVARAYRSVLLVVACASLPVASVAGTSYVTKAGSVSGAGSQGSPFVLLESAVAKELQDPGTESTIYLGAGTYYEPLGYDPDPAFSTPLTIDGPVTLRAIDGPATIGDFSGVSSSTDLSVVTWNTRLFGGAAGFFSGGNFEDDIRGLRIGELAQQYDFVGFQESWDSDDSPSRAWPLEEQLTNTWVSDDVGEDGLVLGAAHQLMHLSYGTFQDSCPDFCKGGADDGDTCTDDDQCASDDCADVDHCNGALLGSCDNDCGADKGWIRSTIVKDGFRITVYNTHLDAGQYYLYDPDDCAEDAESRKDQTRCLFNHVDFYRTLYPSDVVFVIGDFNVIGDNALGNEYSVMTAEIELQTDGARDAARHAPQWVSENGGVTNSPTNELANCIDGDNFDAFRFDYIIFYGSSDGTIEVLPASTTVGDTLLFATEQCCSFCEDVAGDCSLIGIDYCKDECFDCDDPGHTTRELSDHWPVIGQFKLLNLAAPVP